MVCLFFAAAVAACLSLLSPHDLTAEGHDGEQIVLTGQVYEYRQYADRTVLWLKNLQEASNAAAGALPAPLTQDDRCICYCKQKEAVSIGSIACVKGKRYGFSEARNPGEFDYAQYYRTQDIAFCVRGAQILSFGKSGRPLGDAWAWLCNALRQIREQASGLFVRYLDEDGAGILSAMLLGDKSMLGEEVRALYRESGISHILAISGLHISMLGMLIYRLLCKTILPRQAARGLSAALMILYGIMTGMSLSAQRAIVMFVIGINAERVGRTYDIRTAMSVTMAALLWFRPRMIGTAAFQLSFGAVMGLAFVEPALSWLCARTMGREKRTLPKLFRSFLSGLSVSLVTFPILLLHQHEYAVYGIFFNLLLLPSVAVLIPAGMCVLFFGALAKIAAGLMGVGQLAKAGGSVLWKLFDSGAKLAAAPCRLLLSLYEAGSRMVSSLPGNLLFGRPNTLRIAIYGGMILVFALGVRPLVERAALRKRSAEKGKREEKKRTVIGRRCAVFGGCLSYLALALLILLVPMRRGLVITVLDVGQGDGICIEHCSGHAILLDCGSTDQSSLLENRLIPFLKYEGIYELDAVFLSHLDQDHISAVAELLQKNDTGRIAVRQLVLAQWIPKDEAYEEILSLAEAASVPVRRMCAGDSYEQGRLKLTCLGPDMGADASRDRNACSLVLRLDYGNFSALFMGDADAAAERRALAAMNEYAQTGEIMFLKVAHHGSSSSSTESFLAAVKPKFSVISCSAGNPYGHPHGEVLKTLEKQGCDIYRTDESGAVTVHTDGEKVWVETYLKQDWR